MTTEETHESIVFRDEQLFFNIVQTSPDLREAIDLLRRAKHVVLRLKLEAVARGDGDEDQRLSATLTRLNDEIHYQTRIEDAAHIRRAADLLFGGGAWTQIVSLHKALVQQARIEIIR